MKTFPKKDKMIDGIFNNKKILVTGHTGFKGSWLSIFLIEMGAEVIGYALEPYTENDIFLLTKLESKINHILGDIRDFDQLKKVFDENQPEMVFHLAAQTLVSDSYINPKETYDINIGGSVNVLECCRLTDSVRIIINVTSDKCYENKEWLWGYRENDSLGGYDPYSSSKGCSELITNAFRNSYFNPENYDLHQKSISSVRAGNVVGGGDWRDNRLVPDCIRSLLENEPIELRNPASVRPWQHVIEPLFGYILLVSKMYKEPQKYSGDWNFGPNLDSIVKVSDIAGLIIKKWGIGKWIDISRQEKPHETHFLSLDSTKAKLMLNWKPVWGVEKMVDKTVEWYKSFNINDLFDLSYRQIEEYMKDLYRENNV